MIKLRAHQQKAVERARTQKHLALFFDAGTGKTATIARILAEDFNAHKRIRKVLIFAPLVVCVQWPKEIGKFTKIPEDRMHVLTQSGAKRAKKLAEIIESQEGAIIATNYEAVQIKQFYDLLLKFSPDIVVLDESHRIKDSQAKRSKAVYPLCAAADRRFILTGTPTPNSLLDIYGQYKALDPGLFGPGFWSFRSRYFYDKNAGRRFSFPDWVPHDFAAKEIGQKLQQTALQVKRHDCLDLPPLQIIPVPCAMSPKQESAYEEMRKDFMTEADGWIMSSDFEMVKTMRMQQILAGFIQPDERDEPIWFDDLPRMDALMEKVESIGKEQQIIWTVFKPTYMRISQELTKRNISHTFLTGEQVGDASKQINKQKFVSGEAQILIANPAAAGEGIDGLQCAKYAHFYMRGWSLLHYLQALARNYRGGSEEHDKVVHYHFYIEKTIDEVITQALLYKEDIQEKVLNWARTGKMSLDLAKRMQQDTTNKEKVV